MTFYRSEDSVKVLEGLFQSGKLTQEEKDALSNIVFKYKTLTYGREDNVNDFKARNISDIINDCSLDEAYIAKKLANEHPTLQQNFMRICRNFIKMMAEKTYYDGRNEASVEMAKKIVENWEENEPSLPFV